MITTTPDTLELAAQCIEDMRRARLSGADASATLAAVEAEIRDATKARDAAAEERVRGVDGAEERWQSAMERLRAAESQKATATGDSEAAMRVLRSAQARLSQLRELDLVAFAKQAEGPVAECVKAAQQLLPVLEEYIRAYSRAAAQWPPLNPAVRARIEAEDREAGRYRDTDTVNWESQVPPCPLDLSILDVIRTVQPRPRSFTRDRPAQPVEVVFDGAGE